MNTPIGVIASDLTGAMDTAVTFLSRIGDTVVCLDSAPKKTAPTLVLVTDSAADRPEEAHGKVRIAARALTGRTLYKKIDSTMRGNVAPEIAALIDEASPNKVVICPALPREGRTVRDGVALINGVPTHLTSYGSHPVTPCRDADILRLFENAVGLPVTPIGIDDVAQGSAHLESVISTSPHQVVVVDASTDEDLLTIAGACAFHSREWLPAGSSGLASAYALTLRGGRQQAARLGATNTVHRPILAVVGSRNPISIRQLEVLREGGECLLPAVDVNDLCDSSEASAMNRPITEAAGGLSSGKCVAITTSLGPYVESLRHEVAPRLGDLTREIVARAAAGSIVVAGGATAWAVCTALGARRLRVSGEIRQGVVLASLSDGPFRGTHVVTKAGGFGDETTLVRVMGSDKGVPW